MSSVRNASSKPATSSAVAISVGCPAAATSTRLASPTAVRRLAEISADRLARSGEERVAVGEPPRDEPRRDRLVDADAAPGVDQLLRAREPDGTGEAHGAAEPGDQAELHLGLAEARAIRGVDEVARERELESAAEREAVDARDDRRRQPLDRGGRAMPEP